MGVAQHKDLTGAMIHRIGYVQDADPGTCHPGTGWIDTSNGVGYWVLKARNADNDGWESLLGFNILDLDVGGTGSDLSATGPGAMVQGSLGAAVTLDAQLRLAFGGTGSDLSATGPGALVQTALGEDVTVETLDEVRGGTGESSFTKGDILVGDASSKLTKFPVSTDGLFLRLDSTETLGVVWDTLNSIAQDSSLLSVQSSEPTTPDTDEIVLFSDGDGLYYKDDAGDVHAISAYPGYCHAYRDSSQSPGFASAIPIVLDDEAYDYYGHHDAGGANPEYVTIQRKGFYYVKAWVTDFSFNSGNDVQISLRKDATTIDSEWCGTASFLYESYLALEKGDNLFLTTYTNNGEAKFNDSGIIIQMQFQLYDDGS